MLLDEAVVGVDRLAMLFLPAPGLLFGHALPKLILQDLGEVQPEVLCIREDVLVDRAIAVVAISVPFFYVAWKKTEGGWRWRKGDKDFDDEPRR